MSDTGHVIPRQIPTGRDGRPLVTTAQAAYSLGWKPSRFRTWATRHHVTPAAYRPNPNRGQPLALWDLSVIGDELADDTARTGAAGKVA